MTPHSRTGRSLQAAAVLALLTATSCAAIAAAEANKRLPGVVADGALIPSRPAATAFGADPTRTCPGGTVYAELEVRLQAAARDRGAVEVPADGRLCGVAEAILGWQGDNVPPHVRAFLGRYFGLPGGAPEIVVVTLETADPRLVSERVAETIQSYGARVAAPRYGVAGQLAAYKKGGDRAAQDTTVEKTRIVLALYSETVALAQPLPRRLAPGQKAEVVGALQGDLENPKLVVSDAKGRLSNFDAPPGKAFKAEVSCEDKPGRIIVEVRGEDMGNERIIESIPVACATELPAKVSLAPPAGWSADPVAQEQRIIDAVNAERAQAGLPALTLSEPVARIARDLAEGMRDAAKKGAAPVAPVNVAKRLADADIQAPVATQSPAAGPTAEAAFGLLAGNSGARANMMSTEYSDLGVGVAVGQDAQGKPLSYVALLFIKVATPPDVAASKQAIREGIAKKRAAEKVAALAPDAELERIANDYAAVVAAAGGPPPKEVNKKFEQDITKNFKIQAVLRASVIDLSDFAEDPNAVVPGSVIGLGAALGRHPNLGKNTLFVVLVIADPKKGAKPAAKPAAGKK